MITTQESVFLFLNFSKHGIEEGITLFQIQIKINRNDSDIILEFSLIIPNVMETLMEILIFLPKFPSFY